MSVLPNMTGDLERIEESLRGERFELEVLRGRARQRIRPVVVPVFLIGRGEDCDLVLADSAVPEVHSYLLDTEGGRVLRHLGDGPAVRLGERVVTSALLRDGDRLRIGGYLFQVRLRRAEPTLTLPSFQRGEGTAAVHLRSPPKGPCRGDAENLRLYVQPGARIRRR